MLKEDKFRRALAEVMEQDFRDIPNTSELEYNYEFSERFEEKMRKIAGYADYGYVSVGRRRIRRTLAVMLAVLTLIGATAGAIAIQRAIVHWNEVQNDETGTLDVTFDVEKPNGEKAEFAYIKPETPKGYEIVSEEKYKQYYSLEYKDREGKIIMYSQSGEIENMGLSIDNENAEFEEVIIDGYKGYSYSKLGNNMLIWTDGRYLYDITGTCNTDTLYDMAKSVIAINK